MRSIVTLLILFILIAAAWMTAYHPVSAHTTSLAADWRLLRRSAGVRHPLSWLRHQPGVRSADMGADGHTITIHLRDGVTEAILPPPSRSLAAGRPAVFTPPVSPAPQSVVAGGPEVTPRPADYGPPALVMAPFAWQFGTSSTASQVTDLLNEAGYDTTELTNSQVTVASMKTLASYRLVYITGHEGILDDGRIVVSTGQVAPPDGGQFNSEITNGDMILARVDGDSSGTIYYDIAPGFVSKYVRDFAPDSMVVVNGCNSAAGPSLYQAFKSHDIAAYVGWDYFVVPADQERGGEAFIANMAVRGMTASAAVETAVQSGLGQSSFQGQPSQLVLVGYGQLTLASMAQVGVPATGTGTPATGTGTGTPMVATTGTPGSTPATTSAPTGTPTPRPTSTHAATVVPSPSPNLMPPTPTAAVRALSPNWRKLAVHVKPDRLYVGRTVTVRVRVTTPGFRIENARVILNGRGVRAGFHTKYTNRLGVARFRERPRVDGLIFGRVKRPHLKPKKFLLHVLPRR